MASVLAKMMVVLALVCFFISSIPAFETCAADKRALATVYETAKVLWRKKAVERRHQAERSDDDEEGANQDGLWRVMAVATCRGMSPPPPGLGQITTQ